MTLPNTSPFFAACGRTLVAGLAVTLLMAWPAPARAQIRVSPTGVNVSSQTATTVLLTFGGLSGYTPVEAIWCGDLIPAAGVGLQCNPATIYGALPVRYDLSTASGLGALTDIMSVPASVARRAYQAAEAGRSAEFFYVRRFVKAGSADQFVAVTCRLTGGGARVPLSLVDVQLSFAIDAPLLQVATGQRVPAVSAAIVYTGSGRLQGRWEIVLPGQELPQSSDLLSEAALPAEQRSTQARYAEVGTFNVFLDPGGRYTLHGPDPARLPTATDGPYALLLRIEATDDREADSDLGAVGAGTGVLHSGGAAGFPMPVLRYVVGTGNSALSPTASTVGTLQPPDGVSVTASTPIDLRWMPSPQARYYRVDVEAGGVVIHQALIAPGSFSYRLPSFIATKASGAQIRWRVVTVLPSGRDGARSEWRLVTFTGIEEGVPQ